MASATIHGKFDLDLRGKKVEGLAAATANGEAVRYEQIQNLSTHNVILGDNLAEGETLTVPSENWLVLPNSVKHYLYYNTGSVYTITAPAGGYTLAQIAAFIATDETLTLINEDLDVTLHEGTDNTNDTLFQHYYLSVDGGTTALGTPVPVGADEIVAETIQRNAANQTLEQWIAAGNTADNFVPVPANSLTFVSLARNEGLLSNANETKMEVATENGNNYHYDLLRFIQQNGRLVLQTDNLVTRLEDVGGIYPRAASGTDTDYTQPFTLRHGSVWYFENNLWVYEGGLYRDGGLLINDDSKTFANRPQHSSSTADWIRLHSIEWSQHIAYFEGDIVTYTTGAQGSATTTFYRAKTSVTGGANNANPPTDTTTWAVFNVGGFENGTVVRLGAGSTLGADPGVAIATTTDVNTRQSALPSLGLGSMVVDVRTSTSDPINFQGFKPLMTGLDAEGNQQDQNFAVEEASESRQDHVTSKGWQEAYLAGATDVQALQAQVHQIEEELGNAEDYNYATETPYVDAFLTERTDEIGTKLNTITVFYPNFDPVSNVFTTYARLTDAQFSAFDDVANDGNVIIGFGPDSTSLIPFQLLSYGANGRGTITAGEATYEFKLKLIDADEPYDGTGAITDATHKSQFESWNTAEQGGLFYYAEQSANIDTIGHATGHHISGSALTPEERAIVDNLLVPMIDVPTTIPGGPNLTTFAADASQSGSADSGGWYWRNNQTGSGAVTPDPTDWADLVQGDGVSNANSDEWHVLICRPADAAQATLVENIAGNIGFKIANTGGTVTGNNLGSLFVSDGTTDNFAELEVVVSPTSQTSTTQDVRFRIKRVIQSRGVPPVNQTVTISDAGVMVNVPTRSGDPSFQENLDITGNLDVGGAITINGAALPTGITAPQAIAAVEGNANTFTAANTFNTTVNGADANAIAYVAIQLSASVPQEFTPTGAVADHVYLRYTARYNGAEAVLVDDINTGADPVTSTTYVNFVDVANPGTEIPQE